MSALRRLRYRLAKLLVGPFVSIPGEGGVWVVIRNTEDSYSLIEAEKFRVKMRLDLARFAYGDMDEPEAFGRSARVGRFVGTVKA